MAQPSTLNSAGASSEHCGDRVRLLRSPSGRRSLTEWTSGRLDPARWRCRLRYSGESYLNDRRILVR